MYLPIMTESADIFRVDFTNDVDEDCFAVSFNDEHHNTGQHLFRRLYKDIDVFIPFSHANNLLPAVLLEAFADF